MAELAASSVSDIIEELVGRDASEFVGVIAYHANLPVDGSVRWPELTIGSANLSKRPLIELLDRAKNQTERG